jgi:hypothetical protein
MTDGNVVRSDAPGGLSRRTLVAGAAWSVPVVVGLAALPAAAASTTDYVSSWIFNNFTIDGLGYNAPSGTSSQPGKIQGNFGIQWPSPWVKTQTGAVDWGVSGPDSFIMSFELTIDDVLLGAGSSTPTGGSITFSRYSTEQRTWSQSGLTPGEHVVQFSVSTATASYGGHTYSAQGTIKTFYVTVNP